MDTELPRSRVEAVRANLSAASQGRYPAPKLIAVTKTHPPEMILPLREMGISDIGENRVQEIEEKLPALGENFRIHLIGRLQSNKVMPVLVQLSPAGEPQKGGLPPENVRAFLREVSRMPGLHVRGLMAVMPLSRDEAYLSGLFAGMRTLFEQLREEAMDGVDMEELSMGMSGDYMLAARHGATMVRVGSALFGPRG